MKGNKRTALLLVLALALSLLCGCSPMSTISPQHTVTLIAKSTQTEFWLSVFAGAKAAATEYNLDLNIIGPSAEEDYETQNQMVQDAVGAGSEALVFSAIHYDNNADAINQAAQAGLKIVAIDSNVNSSAVSTYIGTDNYAAGQMAAQAALERVSGQLNVGIINYDVSSANGQERERGAVETFTKSGRAQVVTVVNTLSDAHRAQADTEALLQQNPDINVLLAFNEPTSVGAAQAIQDRNQSDQVFLVGFDSNVHTVDGLQDGSVDALIVQNPYAMGYLGVESAYKLLTGQKKNLPEIVDTSTSIVDRTNLFTMDSKKALFAFESQSRW